MGFIVVAIYCNSVLVRVDREDANKDELIQRAGFPIFNHKE